MDFNILYSRVYFTYIMPYTRMHFKCVFLYITLLLLGVRRAYIHVERNVRLIENMYISSTHRTLRYTVGI